MNLDEVGDLLLGLCVGIVSTIVLGFVLFGAFR